MQIDKTLILVDLMVNNVANKFPLILMRPKIRHLRKELMLSNSVNDKPLELILVRLVLSSVRRQKERNPSFIISIFYYLLIAVV